MYIYLTLGSNALEHFFVVSYYKQSPLQPIKQTVLFSMSGQVSRGIAGYYQSDERAGVAWLSWRVSG